MSLSSPFIHRPVGTTLLTIAVALAGMLAYFMLPVSPLPQVDFPTISVNASLPGASPDTMASSVATPLERQFGRIAGVTEMTSSSSLGSTSITLQFDLNRDINAAARDVQACINAAQGYLPANLPSRPSYNKVNPADAPILILSITSDLYDKAHIYDAASSILAQKLAQVQGVGQVNVGGGALPAVRVEVNPTALNAVGLGLTDLSNVLRGANANSPKGYLYTPDRTISLATTDQLLHADQYRPLVVAYHNGAPVRVGDVADVTDSVQDVRNAGLANGKPAILMIIMRQPGANIIDTVDRVKALMPVFQAEIPTAMHLAVVMDRTTTIRASVQDVEYTLILSVGLVILVVFVFLRDWRSTLIPSVAVPVSLIGTFGVMWLCNYSLDNLSLMALTIATGFVVDDAIVVIENITRHLEEGVAPLEAALKGAAEIGFTVLSISVSLCAVFIPLLLMGGIVGRLFREFAVTLSVAIFVSMLISLTTTPMMCAVLLKPHGQQKRGKLLPAQRARVRRRAALLRADAQRRSAARVSHAAGHDFDHRADGVPVHHGAQGVLPRAGHRPNHRQHPGRPGHQLPGHEPDALALRRHGAERPGRDRRHRFLRQRAHQRDGLRHAQTAGAAEEHRRRGDRPHAAQADGHPRRVAVHGARAGPAHRRPQQQRDVPVHPAGRQRAGAARLGTQGAERDQDPARPSRHQQRPTGPRAGGEPHHRPRHRQLGWASRRSRSTTCSATHSGKRRSRRCSSRSTSTTW